VDRVIVVIATANIQDVLSATRSGEIGKSSTGFQVTRSAVLVICILEMSTIIQANAALITDSSQKWVNLSFKKRRTKITTAAVARIMGGMNGSILAGL
jgi:hypothetical protein